MKIRTFLFAAAAFVLASCGSGQTAEEKVKAYEEAIAAMESEYDHAMDSLASDPVAAEAYYNDFVKKYVDFNLKSAKKNPDNEVAVQVLMNLRGLIGDEQASEIIAAMPAEMLKREDVASLKKGLDARIATAEGKPFVDFTVNSVVG